MAPAKGKIQGRGKTLNTALSKAARQRGPGWYRVVTIKVKEGRNPITEYHVELAPTTAPPRP